MSRNFKFEEHINTLYWKSRQKFHALSNVTIFITTQEVSFIQKISNFSFNIAH